MLMDAIDKERVVPIIGDSFYYVVDEEGRKLSVDTFLLKQLAVRFNLKSENIDINSILDVIEEENFKNRRYFGQLTDIYYEICKILSDIEIHCSSEIKNFLSITKFPLVLTTSYVSGLEKSLNNHYGRFDTIIYDKSARADISLPLSSVTPTLYYLFGKCNRFPKSFMATEDDLLDYLHLWHNRDTRPQRISDYLDGKFMLLLGCNYPNWLFRFFWYSIRNFSLEESGTNEMQGLVAMENMNEEKELERFLSRIQTLTYKDSVIFINEFISHWNNHLQKSVGKPGLPIQEREEEIDIFISYAKEDIVIVKDIAARLRNMGAKVWFDDKLEWSDIYEAIIKNKIQQAKRFVPIISQTTMQLERRFYRLEWDMAMKEKGFRYGMPYFAPIVIDDSDVNSSVIPEAYREAHIISSFQDDFEQEMKKLIRSIRQ